MSQLCRKNLPFSRIRARSPSTFLRAAEQGRRWGGPTGGPTATRSGGVARVGPCASVHGFVRVRGGLQWPSHVRPSTCSGGGELCSGHELWDLSGWLRRRAVAAPEPRAQPTACSSGPAAACGSNSRSWLMASMVATPWSSRATPESEEGRVERRVGDRGARALGLRSGGAIGQ